MSAPTHDRRDATADRTPGASRSARRERDVRAEIQHAHAGGGRSLPPAAAQALVPAFGDLSDVRLHVGPASARAAAMLEARAFTVGRDIHFAAGAYAPGTAPGLALLEHELRHAAQPIAPSSRRPWIARPDAAAERDRSRATPREAEIHRFPERGGLTEHEIVPPPFLMQVFGARFLVAVEVATGTPDERAVKFALQVQGTREVTGEHLVGRELRIPAGTARRPVRASLVRLREDSVTIDLHADGITILTLEDRVRVELRNQGWEHHFRVYDGNEGVVGQSTITFPLPPLAANATGAEGGTSASATLSLGGDDITFVARRLEGILVLTATETGGGIDLEHPARWMHHGVSPSGTTTLTPVLDPSGDVWFDLDGDTHPDLRLVHRMADWSGRGQTGRQHWFDAYDRAGVRLQDGRNVGSRGRIVTVDAPGRDPRPPIAAGQQHTDFPDLGAWEDLASIAGDTLRMPGVAPQADARPDTSVVLRVDADGDRARELALVFRPQRECRSDGNRDVELHAVQLSTRASASLTFVMTPDQLASLRPTVAHATDGVRDLVIDLVPSAFDFETTAPPLRLTITPAVERCGQRLHTFSAGDVALTIAFPPEPRRGSPLARDVTAARAIGGLWVIDATLAEYGDRFRFTFDRINSEDFVAITGMTREAGGDLTPGETRRVRLEPGVVDTAPEYIDCGRQELRFAIGERTVVIRDALMSPLYSDPLTHRSHTLSVSGTAVPTPRTIRYDVIHGRFTVQASQYPLLDERSQLPRHTGDRYFDTLAGAGNTLGVSMRNAVDQGTVTQEFYDAVQGMQLAMLRLRAAVAASWDGDSSADIGARSLDALRAAQAITQARGAIVQMHLVRTTMAINARQFGNRFDHYANLGAFGHYLDQVYAWTNSLGPLMQANAMDREAAAAAGAADTLTRRTRPDATVEGLLLQYDAAIGAQLVTAHENGLIGDSLYNAWDRLRRNMPSLRVLADAEADAEACVADGGRILQASEDAGIVAREIAAAVERARAADATRGDAATTAAEGIGPAAHAFAVAVVGHDWPTASTQYDAMMRGLDRWVTHTIRERYGETSDEYRQNQHLHRMHGEIASRLSHPGAIPVAATFAPDSEYHAVSGGITTIPLTVIVFREGGSWHLHDLTPDRPYLASVSDSGELEPPHSLFEKLNDNDRFPKGILYYQIPGGTGDRVRCTAPKDWHEWVRDFGLVVAAIGLGLVTAGTGTVAVIGGYFLAGAAVANAIAAGGELHESIVTGQATTASILLNVFDIIASLAGAGALVSGTVVRTAATAARAGMAWTGAAARVAAFADRMYIPLTAASTLGDVATVAVMSVDAYEQLEQMERSGATPEQIESARRGLLVQLAITGGLTAMSVRGDLPELRSRRNIVLDVVGDIAVARAAGVRIGGVDLELPTDSVRAHAVARWHAEDIEAGRVSLGDDADNFHEWHRRWLQLDRRVTFRADGGYDVRMPTNELGELPPESVQQRLRALGAPDTSLHQAERAFATAEDVAAIERAGPGLRVDPLDARWPDTRRRLLDRLGDTPESEAMIRRFEQARLGALGGNAEAYVQARRHANQVLPDHEIDRIAAMFPGHEVYVRGGLADTTAAISRDISRIEVEVVVPSGTSADQMAAIEQRGRLLEVRPDPGFLQRNGLLPERTLAVDVRVSTPDGFAGRVLTGPPALRIDSPLATRRVELAAVIEHHIAARGVIEGIPSFRVEVLSDDDFARQFGSERHGRAVFRMESGSPVIYARASATPADMLDETSHLIQLRDPDMARRIRMLDETSFHDWSTASVQHRLEMFQTKLEVEIDAKHRTLAVLDAETPRPQVELDEVRRQLDDLEALQREIARITPRQLSMLNAGAIPMPPYLEHPPWMFGRRSSVTGVRPNRFAIDPSAPRTTVPELGPERSTVNRRGIARVEQIGSSWTERTLVFSDVDGTVTSIAPVDRGETVITVTRSGTGATFTYRLERGATLDVAVGDPVHAGQRLGEDAREYRLIETVGNDGRRTLREEIRRLPPADGWQQRGSESTFRGAVMERAALAQLEAESAFRIARGEISGTVRIPHAREGGGFDHVFVEFTGTGAGTRARIRIIEVKDYPGRSVPLGEFTAITGTGLTENLRILRNDARAARDAIRAGVALPPSFAALGLDPHQLDAIHTALRTPGSTTVEVMVGPTTRIGAEGHHAAKVLPAIRRDVDAALGAGAFRTVEDGEPTTILQSYADMANAAETAARARTGTGP